MNFFKKDWVLYSFFVLVNVGLSVGAFVVAFYRYGLLTSLVIGSMTLTALVILYLVGRWLAKGEEEMD